jgi:DNA-binding SARP family transcriptional activator/ABC-type sugar transport system substrate-binding protein
VEYRILGPLEVVEDGNPVALGTLKERLVLGILLLHANEFVSRERLIDELWGVSPPATARKAVNVYISKLRQTLTRDGEDPIATADGGYRLVVDLERLDSGRVSGLIAEARERMAAGDPEAASGLLEQALAFWRGPTLAGLQLESLGRDEVAAFDELRLAALMDRIDCQLALGRHDQVLGELSVLVREHPLRERLRAQQMLALYRAGRQAEALAAYREARRVLVDDLGIEPSEALQRLQQAILRHDTSLETPTGTAAIDGGRALPATPAEAPAVNASLPPPRRRRRPLRPRRLVLAGLVAFAAVAASAAVLSTRAAAHRTYTVAYVTPAVGEDSVQSLARGSRAAAARLGVRYILAGPPPTGTEQDLVNVYRKMIARHVDAIISDGYDPNLTQVFGEVRKAGILLISSGDDIAAKRDLWVSQSDALDYAHALAETLAAQTHGEGEYAILGQEGEYPIATDWTKLVEEYIAKAYPRMKLDGVIVGTGAVDPAEIDSVKGFIAAHQRLKGLIAIVPRETFTAAEAIIQSGRLGKVFCAGNGGYRLGDTQLPDFVRSGAAELVYGSDPLKQGYLSVWAAKYLLAGHHFRPGVGYQVGGPIGTVWYYPAQRELRLGQPLVVTRKNLNQYVHSY